MCLGVEKRDKNYGPLPSKRRLVSRRRDHTSVPMGRGHVRRSRCARKQRRRRWTYYPHRYVISYVEVKCQPLRLFTILCMTCTSPKKDYLLINISKL